MKLSKTILNTSLIALSFLVFFVATLPNISLAQSNSFDSMIFPLTQSSNYREEVIPLYTRGYIYPISFLGNCSNKQDCFTYCEQAVNIPACSRFAERQGIMQLGSAATAERWVKSLLSGITPGDCNSARSCIQFCDDQQNSESCLSYASSLDLQSRVLGDSDGLFDNSKPEIANLFESCSGLEQCTNQCLNLTDSRCRNVNDKFSGLKTASQANFEGLEQSFKDNWQNQLCIQNVSSGDCGGSGGGSTGGGGSGSGGSGSGSGGGSTGGGSTGGGTTPSSTPAEILNNVQSCVEKKNTGIVPAYDPVAKQQFYSADQQTQLDRNYQECEKQFASGGSDDHKEDKQKAVTEIGSIQECLFSATKNGLDNRELQNCIGRIAQ